MKYCSSIQGRIKRRVEAEIEVEVEVKVEASNFKFKTGLPAGRSQITNPRYE
jgi:hypothetical protein